MQWKRRNVRSLLALMLIIHPLLRLASSKLSLSRNETMANETLFNAELSL